MSKNDNLIKYRHSLTIKKERQNIFLTIKVQGEMYMQKISNVVFVGKKINVFECGFIFPIKGKY